jgi:predicted RNA-binding Zn-ribbon protein involved in translation (DUF1610 family)
MSRPPLEVADLIRSAGAAFIDRNRQWIRWKHVKVLLAIARCRTAALGGHIDQCTRCGHRAHNNEQKLMSLSLDEFLRRFLLHLLPKGFVRIRNFGFLANRRRATLLPLCFQLLGAVPQPQVDQDTSRTSDLWHCPQCGGPMVVVERFTAAEIQLRSPPLAITAA